MMGGEEMQLIYQDKKVTCVTVKEKVRKFIGSRVEMTN